MWYYISWKKGARLSCVLSFLRCAMRTVVYFGSREIYKDFPTAVHSLLAHTKVDKIYAIIEDDALPYDLPVEVINWKGEEFNGLNTGTKWKKFGCIRPALSKILPQEDIVLSLDLDTIVEADISELFDIDMSGYYFAAVKEPWNSDFYGYPYFNMGVCLLNLKLMRETGKDDEMIQALNTVRFQYVSQDVMSHMCKEVLELPSDYNVCDFTLPTHNIKIQHYADKRDWRCTARVQRWL